MTNLHWQYTDATRGAIRCTCEECKAFNNGDSEGRTIAIGTQIGEAEEINKSVTVTAAETGYEDQTITASGTVKWVVLGYEDQDGNGTNETLLLTTDTVIGDKLILAGAAVYNNVVDTEEKDGILTKVCKGLYGENVRSMKIEDANRAMGFDETPKGMQLTSSGLSIIDTTKNKKNKKLSELGETWEAIKASTDSDGKLYTPEHPEGMATGTDEEKATAEANLGKYEVDGYMYMLEENTAGIPLIDSNISSEAKSLIFGSSNEYLYILASHMIFAEDKDPDPNEGHNARAVYTCAGIGDKCAGGAPFALVFPPFSSISNRSIINYTGSVRAILGLKDPFASDVIQ